VKTDPNMAWIPKSRAVRRTGPAEKSSPIRFGAIAGNWKGKTRMTISNRRTECETASRRNCFQRFSSQNFGPAEIGSAKGFTLVSASLNFSNFYEFGKVIFEYLKFESAKIIVPTFLGLLNIGIVPLLPSSH